MFMILNLEWLKDVLDTTAKLSEICKKLNEIGLEVENDVPDEHIFDKIVVAKILECYDHPDSDHLHVCKVSDGNETYQIVCGAPNARAGIKVALALVGAYIPQKDLKIKKVKIRGIESCGMMCSEKELGIGKDSDGIIELSDECEIGKPFTEEYKAFDKIPFEISITPNRGDAANVYGIARDLSACGLGKLKQIEQKYDVNETIKNEHTVDVKIDNCKYFCREIEGINLNTKTPEYILKRNSINGCGDNGVVVNILNYIMFTYGQPMHSYDSDKIGKNITIDYAKNETFLTLKNETIKYNKNKILAVNDDNGEICIAGVMGGNNSKTTNETKNILLESAYFPPTPITISGQELNIISDARFRYERGIDPDLTEQMLNLATNMIVEICGGKASNIISNGHIDDNKKITYPIDFTKKILGFEIEKNKIINILSSLQFKVKDNIDSLEILVPKFRHDIELPADIAEEIARIDGYDNIPTIPYELSKKFVKNIFNEKIKDKKFLASKGLIECVSFGFCDIEKAKLFSNINEDLLVTNPISSELNYMIPTLILNLLDAIAKNESLILENQLSFFEEGMIFTSPDKNGQHNSIAGVYCGKSVQNFCLGKDTFFDIFDAKKTLFELLEKVYYVNTKNLKISKCKQKYTHPTRSFDVTIKNNDNCIARYGEISPIVLKKFKIKNTVCFFEVFKDNFDIQKTKKKEFTEYSLQPIVRDIAFIVDNSILADQIIDAYKNPLITSINVVDIYQISDEKKSMALRYIFQPIELITNEQINNLMNEIIKAVESKTNGKVRDGK